MEIVRREGITVPRPPGSHSDNPRMERALQHIYAHLWSEKHLGDVAGGAASDAIDTSYNTDERWVNRGDPAAVDWSIAAGTLTDDGAWHDLDLTSVHVNIADKPVLLRGYLASGGVATMELREKGNSNAENVAQIHPPSGGATWADLLVIPDEDGVIQYRISVAATVAELTVAAWEQGFSGGTVEGAAAADVDLNTTHRLGDGLDHSEVGNNAGDIVTNAAAIALNTTHRGSDGSDHGYIDQDVQTTAEDVEFDGLEVVTEFVLPVSAVPGMP